MQYSSSLDFKRQVAFFIDGIYFCSGTLISNEWILTAVNLKKIVIEKYKK